MKSPETKLKVMEDCDLNGREYKIPFLKLNRIQKISVKPFTELRKNINEQKESFTKGIKTIKKKELGRYSGAEELNK